MAETHPLVRFRQNQKPRWSQDKLGSEVGVDGFTVYRWEKRKNLPREEQLRKLSEITGLSVGAIVEACMPRETEAA